MISQREESKEDIYPEQPIFVNVRRMAANGVQNPNFTGSTLTLNGSVDTMDGTAATSYSSKGHSNAERDSSSNSTTETIHICPQHEAAHFTISWDNVESYVENRKAMGAPVLIAKNSTDFEPLNTERKRKCKFGRYMQTIVFALASLTMIGAIVGVVTAEIFVKRGYFWREQRRQMALQEFEDIQPDYSEGHTVTDYNFTMDYDWFNQFTTPMSNINENETVLATTQLPRLTPSTLPPRITEQESKTTARVPRTTNGENANATRSAIPETTTELYQQDTAVELSTMDNSIPQMVKLLTIPGPLQRFGKN